MGVGPSRYGAPWPLVGGPDPSTPQGGELGGAARPGGALNPRRSPGDGGGEAWAATGALGGQGPGLGGPRALVPPDAPIPPTPWRGSGGPGEVQLLARPPRGRRDLRRLGGLRRRLRPQPSERHSEDLGDPMGPGDLDPGHLALEQPPKLGGVRPTAGPPASWQTLFSDLPVASMAAWRGSIPLRLTLSTGSESVVLMVLLPTPGLPGGPSPPKGPPGAGPCHDPG